MNDELENAIARTKAQETPDTWMGYLRQNKWSILMVAAMFVLVLMEIGAVRG